MMIDETEEAREQVARALAYLPSWESFRRRLDQLDLDERKKMFGYDKIEDFKTLYGIQRMIVSRRDMMISYLYKENQALKARIEELSADERMNDDGQ